MAGIYGYGASEATRIFIDPFYVEMYGDKMFESRSFTLVYAHSHKRRRNRVISVGQRQPNDKLLKFASNTNVIIKRFPESDFEFYDDTKYLTYVKFSFSVSMSLCSLYQIDFTLIKRFSVSDSFGIFKYIIHWRTSFQCSCIRFKSTVVCGEYINLWIWWKWKAS